MYVERNRTPCKNKSYAYELNTTNQETGTTASCAARLGFGDASRSVGYLATPRRTFG